MRKFFKCLLCFCLALGICVFPSCIWKGCDKVSTTGLKTEGYFHFYEYDDVIRIRDFSLEGKELESCYLPAYINGKPVTAAGHIIFIHSVAFLESEKLTYLNLPYSVTESTGFRYISQLKTLVFSSVTPLSHFGGYDPLPNANVKIYVPSTAVTDYEQMLNGYPLIEAANINYLFHYDDAPNDGIYTVDHKEAGSTLYQPIAPQRDGYEFCGWYSDFACTVPWNFAEDSIPAAEIYLYAKWKATS